MAPNAPTGGRRVSKAGDRKSLHLALKSKEDGTSPSTNSPIPKNTMLVSLVIVYMWSLLLTI
jgi:hypothetical protein